MGTGPGAFLAHARQALYYGATLTGPHLTVMVFAKQISVFFPPSGVFFFQPRPSWSRLLLGLALPHFRLLGLGARPLPVSWRPEVPGVGAGSAGPSLRSGGCGRGCDGGRRGPAWRVVSARVSSPQPAPWRGPAARGVPSHRASWRPSGGCGRYRAAWAAARRPRCIGCAAAAPRARPPEPSSSSCLREPPGLRPRPPNTVSAKRGRRWSSCRVTGTSVIVAVCHLLPGSRSRSRHTCPQRASLPPGFRSFRWEERIGPRCCRSLFHPPLLCSSLEGYGGGDCHLAVLRKVLFALVFSRYSVA